jgi:hypothetical protein
MIPPLSADCQSPDEAVLRLEYATTPAERTEAQSLSLRQIGGGSKWLTLVILLLIMGLAAWFLWTMVRKAIPVAYQPYAIGAVAGLWAFLFIREQRKLKSAAPLVKVELSSRGISFAGIEAQAVIPWSAFSRRIESDSLFLFQDRSQTRLYIVPKRVIPSEDWLDWIRLISISTAHTLIQAADDRETRTENSDPAEVTVQFQMRFGNWIDFTIASWWGRCAALAWIGMWIGVSIYSSFEPHPNAKFTNLQTFIYFGIPCSVIGAVLLIIFLAAHSWTLHTRSLRQRTITLGATSLSIRSNDGAFTVPLSAYSAFKETRWSFLLWDRFSRSWLLLPKTAFPSVDSIDRCRELLSKHLKHSTWFFGH